MITKSKIDHIRKDIITIIGADYAKCLNVPSFGTRLKPKQMLN